MFISLYNDIDWSNWKRNEDICEGNADLGATCVEQAIGSEHRPAHGTIHELHRKEQMKVNIPVHDRVWQHVPSLDNVLAQFLPISKTSRFEYCHEDEK